MMQTFRARHAQRSVKLSFASFFVATKKMTLLSGNPDGFDFVLLSMSAHQ